MTALSQKDPRWKNTPFATGKYTIGSDGCFLTCFSMLADNTPPAVDALFRSHGCYQGDLIIEAKCAEALGLPYQSRSVGSPKVLPCVAETNYYAASGYKQHFFIVLNDKEIIDPLDGKQQANKYKDHIVSYRNIGGKGDDVTNEEAKLLIYVATQGHEPQGDERSFALGGISPIELAKLRFRDDVVGSSWIASNGDYCPQGEKDFWQKYQEDNNGHPVETFGRQWYADHVVTKLAEITKQRDDARANSDNVQSQLESSINESARLEALLNEKTAAYDQLGREAASTNEELQKAKDSVTTLAQQLKDAQQAAPQTMSGLQMILAGIYKIISKGKE